MEKMGPVIYADIRIPMELVREFDMEPRIVIRHPWVIGIPAPEIFLKAEVFKRIEEAGFDVMLVPKRFG